MWLSLAGSKDLHERSGLWVGGEQKFEEIP